MVLGVWLLGVLGCLVAFFLGVVFMKLFGLLD
jgi:hypothetical protein